MKKSSLLEESFPELDPSGSERILRLEELLLEENRKVNLISRKETALLERHILPSLLPLKFLSPPANARVMDVGTGGGLPGLPLAIAYPELEFLLLDSTRKKLDAVERMAEALGLKNVRTEHERIEKSSSRADLICGRAVTALPRFIAWCRPRLVKSNEAKGDRGILYWTGGDIEEELKGSKGKSEVHRMETHLKIASLASKAVVRISFP